MRPSRPSKLTIAFAALATIAILLPGSAVAQQGTNDGEWRVYGGDPGHTRYAGLDQIDASNVGDLEVVWRWTGRNFGPNPNIRSSTTPLMVDGVLYATAGMRRAVVAIDAGTGAGALATAPNQRLPSLLSWPALAHIFSIMARKSLWSSIMRA